MDMDNPEIIVEDESRHCAQLQLSEIEMLQSMYPDRDELCIKEETMFQLKSFVSGSESQHSGLELTLNLTTGKGKVRMDTVIPPRYPNESLSLYVRSDQLNREKQNELNTKLNEYLQTIDSGNLVVGCAAIWLQANADNYLVEPTILNEGTIKSPSTGDDMIFSRAWIYSHHIYNKVKRKNIKDLADEYGLTGFCLPGKPGLICVEGSSQNVKEWWNTVHSWNWQRIVCTKMEEDTIQIPSDAAKLRRFNSFEELGSESDIRVKANGHRVDMGDLFQYLEEHHSGYMFQEYFGVKGREK